MATLQVIQTPIEGVTIEHQPLFGTFQQGGVIHMLPGGIQNPEGFGQDLLDIYAFTAKGRNVFRGGHYHPKLNELFFTMSGTALWILSDFREGSPTHGTTHAVILSIDTPTETYGFPTYSLEEGRFPRLRVPAGIYHAIFPLTDERLTSVALGSTAFDKEDYRYPKPEEVPGMKEILERIGFKEGNP